ncbi:hypothetical protein XENOCAPTIV_006565, partial [Xenoophorus captivus]
REFQEGLWKDNCEPSALLFVREIPRQRIKDGPKRLAKFMDITVDELLNAEAQELLTGLKSRLYATSKKILNLHCVELSKGSIDPKRKEHAQYLDSICQQFVSQMTTRIRAAVGPLVGGRWRKTWGSTEKDEEDLDWMVEEVRQHSAMATKLSKDLHGRDGLLGKICITLWESTTVHHGPLVVHSAAGMGKTTLLCKLTQEMQCALEARAVLVIRLLAANHPQRPNINNVLHSICLQVCLACGLTPPPLLSVSSHLELRRFFQNMLEDVSRQGKTLLIILDSLEQLADEHQAHKLHWLPTDIPPNVYLLVSMDTTSEAFANMRLKLGAAANLFEVEPLFYDEGEQVMESYLRASQRTLTRVQKDIVLQSFKNTGSPLHLKLILSAAKRWTSFTPSAELVLGASTQEVMSGLLLKLEEKHGKELVSGTLGCIVLARLPPLLWARLKWDLKDQLEERWTEGVTVIAFNSRKLQELPYHLLHAGLWEELRQEVIGSAEWLYCKSRVCGVSSVISDLDQCFKYMNCSETRLVRDALILMKPSLDVLSGHMDQSLFYSELLARLSSLSSTFCAVIGQLCSQCEDWLQMCQIPVLIPKSSFLQQPGGALQHTLTAPHGGVLCLDIDVAVQLLVTGSADGVVAVWSLEDKQLMYALQGPPGAILSVKIIESSTHCLSLAADGSLRRWSLKSGQQLLCIQEAGPAGPAPSSVHLEVSDELLFVYSWTQVGGGRSLMFLKVSLVNSSALQLFLLVSLCLFPDGHFFVTLLEFQQLCFSVVP